MQDRIEQQIQTTEKKQLEVQRRERALQAEADRIQEVSDGFTARETDLQNGIARIETLKKLLEKQRDDTEAACNARIEDAQRRAKEANHREAESMARDKQSRELMLNAETRAKEVHQREAALATAERGFAVRSAELDKRLASFTHQQVRVGAAACEADIK